MIKKSLKTIVLSSLLSFVVLEGCKESKSTTESIPGKAVVVTPPKQAAKSITWEQMVSEIRKGEYKGISLDHSKTLMLIGNNDTIYQAAQPEIDAYLKILETCEKCPNIPVATE